MRFMLIIVLIPMIIFADDNVESKKDPIHKEGERPRKAERDGDKEGERPRKAERDGDREGEKSSAKSTASERKTQRIFKAYDKNGNQSVSFDEWLKMKEGKVDDARKAREKKWFNMADKNSDGEITVKEFHLWLNRRHLREDGTEKSAEKGDKGKEK